MFSYFDLIKNVSIQLASTSGVTTALRDADQDLREPVIHLGYDFNQIPSSDDGPVLIILPSASPVDSGNGVVNMGVSYLERNPAFYVQWQFTNSSVSTTSGVVCQDGIEHVDKIGRIIVDTIESYFDGLGYQLSYVDFDTTITECYPTFSGAAVIAVRGLVTLGSEPFA